MRAIQKVNSGELLTLHNEELPKLYTSPNIYEWSNEELPKLYTSPNI
jgi:hypothetical protein